MDAVSRMKNGKATGTDNISAEVFKNLILTKHDLFFFLEKFRDMSVYQRTWCCACSS